MLESHLKTFDEEEEGDSVPRGFPRVIDAHVHIFPDELFEAVRQWFKTYGWRNRYELTASEIFDFLLTRGVDHIVALQYAHKPGISAGLNRFMVKKCREFPGRITGLVTVFPGEENAGGILQEAFDSDLGGIKLHAHVQCFDINSEECSLVFDVCEANNKPAVIHFGTEPKSTAYQCDPYKICAADKLECVLKNFPELKVCVPHLGFSELAEYKTLIEKYDTLWLDTTMVVSDYFPIANRIPLKEYRMDRIMYGSDFPNIPFAWDRELKWLQQNDLYKDLSDDDLDRILNGNAVKFFNIGGPVQDKNLNLIGNTI